MPRRVVVIGGGPSGMMAGGTAGSRGLDVLLIEKNNTLGKKLLLTGKGRCNFTNDTSLQGLIDNIPVNGRFLYSAFSKFSNKDLVKFFNNLGIKTKVERGGRVFPESDRARDILNALERYLRDNNVKIIRGEVKKILKDNSRVLGVALSDGRFIPSDSVIIATGGLSYPKTGSTGDGYRFAEELGHSIAPLKPSLVPLEVEESWVSKLQGLTLKNVSIRVINQSDREVYSDLGDMLFTHFGVSGPIILSASSHMRDIDKNRYRIIIDLKPGLTEEKLDRRIQRDFTKYSRRLFANSLGELLPKSLIPVIVELSGIPRDKYVNQITREERKRLVRLLKNLLITVSKFRPIEEAIVTSGGVNVSEINPSTMESKIVKGLFFAGEVIDVDGYTGGFNLQIAFSTGYVAGSSC
ncbi:NAD(P)/FAD-dependent oxidoreductase [bacterium]|nr:NAD(P)/FAD-dependent oxidoreductase [bacterium]